MISAQRRSRRAWISNRIQVRSRIFWWLYGRATTIMLRCVSWFVGVAVLVRLSYDSQATVLNEQSVLMTVSNRVPFCSYCCRKLRRSWDTSANARNRRAQLRDYLRRVTLVIWRHCFPRDYLLNERYDSLVVSTFSKLPAWTRRNRDASCWDDSVERPWRWLPEGLLTVFVMKAASWWCRSNKAAQTFRARSTFCLPCGIALLYRSLPDVDNFSCIYEMQFRRNTCSLPLKRFGRRRSLLRSSRTEAMAELVASCLPLSITFTFNSATSTRTSMTTLLQ